jgi:hypothetical protein
VAVLDVNLGGPSSFAVADELSLRGGLGRVLVICLTAAGKRP